MRGRLINPFYLKIAQLDLEAMNTGSAFDPVFREPKPAGGGADSRVEKTAVYVPAQIEVGTYERMSMQADGDDPDSRIIFVFHFQDLEDAGMVDANGQPTLRLGDRAVSIHRYSDESLIQILGLDGKGIFVTELQPQSFGLSGGERNLLLATFENRNVTAK